MSGNMMMADLLMSESPRPSSVGSNHSTHSSLNLPLHNRGKGGGDICIGEEIKIAIGIALERFRFSEERKELEFPSSLASTERAYIHRLCQGLGLKSKSKGKGANRSLTVCKKAGTQTVHSTAMFNLARNSRHQIHTLLQRFPLTTKERQDLQPRIDRGQYDGMAKDLSRSTTTGRLNNGVPQVPPPRGDSDLASFRQSLPVYLMKDTIIRALNDNKVLMIAGETGSGKTTQVPQMILDQCESQKKPCRIFCTQPRRLSALSIAERVAAERGEKIGQTVGYQIRLESRVSPKTLLTFCTNGVLLRTLMGGDNALSTVTHVIIDEIHERDRFSDFLLIAIRDLLPKQSNLKLVLMSAALNIQLFSSYFSSCPIINVPGKLFEVQEFFLEDILNMTNYTNKEMDVYRQRLDHYVDQQKNLESWCDREAMTDTPESPSTSTTSSRADDLTHGLAQLSTQDSLDSTHSSDGKHEPSPEKDDLEPWLVVEMDSLLSEAWLHGKEEAFTQLIHLILTEDVSVDYGHSQTSITPLMVAAGRDFYTVVEQLLSLGANANIRASNDWTALDWARKFERIDIIELLEAQMASSTEVRHDESLLVKRSQSLTPEDRALLDVYHHCFDDDKVDLGLVLTLVHKIHTSQQDGAILVFLPGYDEIVSLRDLIQDDKRFLDGNRYILYTLHSQMQSQDQRKIFKNPPTGVRKIILATNIAETSITINDVVFVIDSGKVKEKSFDALTSVSMLKCHWVSKASALQRKGRAGRCRAGVCYHLFSRIRYDHMAEYQDPEILRHPLQELCLHTKLLAPINCPIADFLAKAPEPPAFLITRNAVHLLKQIDALDAYEDLTELGHHLADLPVDPRYSKMILYSVVLKCLDPVLTIACALAYKDPFVLPAQAYQKRAAANVRRKYAAGTHSDHMALLRAFQAWQKARTEGWERSFCDKNFLSGATLEMIVGTRTQLLGQLRASGFVRARGGGDIRDLNTNSENWAVVKAALCAGLYPNVIRVDRDRRQLMTMRESKVRIHNHSVLATPPADNYKSSKLSATPGIVEQLPTDWLVYEEITRAHRLAQVKCCTVMSPVTMAIFAGAAKLPYEAVQEAEGMSEAALSLSNQPDACSDSEDEEREDGKSTNFRVDDWVSFRVDTEASNLIMQLRQKWHSLFIRRMRAPAKPWSQVDENVIRAVVTVLTNEEQALGLQQPAGIGQRPRPMASDSFTSSGGSRRGSYDTEYSDDSSTSGADVRHTPTRSRPFKFQATPPRKDLQYYSRSSEDKSETSSVRSGGSGAGSAGGSGANSLRGSAASSPCSSPQLTSPPGKGGDDNHPVRYFIMKSANYKNLDISWQRGIWAATPSNEKRLTKAFKECKEVYLLFSVHGSGHFQGFARMASTIGSERCRELTGNNLGNVFNIQWIKKVNLPFQHAHHLVNPWNENRRVQISRDGQELESVTGESLLKLWDVLPQTRPYNQTPRFSPQASHGPESPRGKGQWGQQQGGYRSQRGHWKGQGYGYGNQPATQTTLSSSMGSPQMSAPFSPVYVTPIIPHQGAAQMLQKQSSQNSFPSQQSPGQPMSPVMILQRHTPAGTNSRTTTGNNESSATSPKSGKST